MNLKAISSGLLIAALATSPAFASTGTITFTGSIANVTCQVNGGTPDSGSPDFTVNVGAVNAADFANVGDIAGNTGFRVYIGGANDTTCADGTRVWATFEPGATVNPATGALVTQGSAAGVEIRLFNKLGQPIDAWSDNQQVVQETVTNHQAILPYSAAYQRTTDVTAGDANSSVLYSVRYEAI